VTIVVLVLMMSCHVSEKPNTGPLKAHATTMAQQAMNVAGMPAACATVLAIRVNVPFNVMPEPLDREAA
jgi:hypothetical protein